MLKITWQRAYIYPRKSELPPENFIFYDLHAANASELERFVKAGGYITGKGHYLTINLESIENRLRKCDHYHRGMELTPIRFFDFNFKEFGLPNPDYRTQYTQLWKYDLQNFVSIRVSVGAEDRKGISSQGLVFETGIYGYDTNKKYKDEIRMNLGWKYHCIADLQPNQQQFRMIAEMLHARGYKYEDEMEEDTPITQHILFGFLKSYRGGFVQFDEKAVLNQRLSQESQSISEVCETIQNKYKQTVQNFCDALPCKTKINSFYDFLDNSRNLDEYTLSGDFIAETPTSIYEHSQAYLEKTIAEIEERRNAPRQKPEGYDIWTPENY